MPNVSEVRPKIWEDVLDLFDDGEFSAIWGRRESNNFRELAIRWNGDENYVGYPNQGRNPTWFSQPEFLEESILLSLLKQIVQNDVNQRREEFIDNILQAMKESKQKIKN